MDLLSRLGLRRGTSQRTAVLDMATQPIAATIMRWRADAAVPRPDWEAMEAPDKASSEELYRFWSGAARAWLETLAATLGPSFSVLESGSFMLLSPLPDRQRELILGYAERTRKRVMQVLAGIARDDGSGKTVILVLDSQERYYEYISVAYPEPAAQQEFATSGGMFIDDGYGHFVFVMDEIDRVEPIIAHESTHCFVRHLPLPAWVDEGLAVATERRLCPLQRDLYTPDEITRRHRAFWDASLIQEFWSGKSWLRPGDANLLSYDLALKFVTVMAANWPAFVAFVNAASNLDGGDAAAREHLGYPVAHLADAVLGAGSWTPDPGRWRDGVERGQFRAR